MPPPINPSSEASIHPLTPPSSRFCVSSLSLFPVIYLPSEEAPTGVTFSPWLRFDPRGLAGDERVEGKRLWTNPPRVPSLLRGTYLTKPRMHGPRELQPLCMIIENPRDTSQPHSRVIYYYFVSITSERTSRVGWVLSIVGSISMSYADWYSRGRKTRFFLGFSRGDARMFKQGD